MDLQYRAKNNILKFEKLTLRWLCDFGSVSLREPPGPCPNLGLPCHKLAGPVSFAGAEGGMAKAWLGRGGPGGQSLGPPGSAAASVTRKVGKMDPHLEFCLCVPVLP